VKLQKCLYAGLVVIGLNFLIGSAQSQDNNPVPAVIPVPAINSATAVNSARSISESGLPGMDMKISLDLMQPMEVVDLIKFLTVKGNLNVIFGRDVTGSTKLMLKEVTLGDALDIVLAANGLAWEVKNNILKIMNDKEYRDLYGQGFYEQKKVKVVELRYALPSRVAPMLAEVKGSNGKVVFDDGTGTLILIDTPEQILAMEAVIARADIPTVERVLPTETRAFTLQYAKVEDIQGEILPILTRDIGKMRVDKRTQTLVITDLPHNLGKAAQVIALFDTMPRQVFIEAKIVIVSLNKGFKLGVNWDNVINYINPRAALSIASPFPVTATDQGLGSVSYRTVTGDGDLNAVITALETMGDTKVLSNPHIAVMNGEEATIKVVTDKPYAELMYESGTTNVVGKTYKFIPVGVTLTVTPKINDEKFIQMTVRPEVSDVVDVYDSTDPRYGVPVVQKSYAETKVQVKDGVTIIIAGMIKEDKRETVTGLPFLSRIPLLGALFRSKVTSSENSELIVFLTPKIVTGAEPYLRAKDLKELKLSTTAEK
jgi:type II secretory pathway component GspD/PulD (secretin)